MIDNIIYCTLYVMNIYLIVFINICMTAVGPLQAFLTLNTWVLHVMNVIIWIGQ